MKWDKSLDRILKSAWPNNISLNIFTLRKKFIQWHINVRISNRKRCRWCLELSGSQLVEEPTTRDGRWRSRSRPNWLPEVPVGWGVRVRNQSGPGAGLILTTSLARLIITLQRLDLATVPVQDIPLDRRHTAGLGGGVLRGWDMGGVRGRSRKKSSVHKWTNKWVWFHRGV